ncbi:MAG: hypothetical protein K0S27_893 [Gammaproteobacteria bacterium]|jgi:hypothetical protein|nr:hypothetical protein [Gammaproteobacteria bacterium]
MPTYVPPSPSINRFYHQLIRDMHLTFRQKCRDLVMQIFGHEMLIDKKEMADIKHCTVFNMDFYRLNRITWAHIAPRKLLNPFKWVEFGIVVPLELLSWGINQLPVFIYHYIKKNKEEEPGYGNSRAFEFFAILHWCLIGIGSLFNLTTHLITGTARRFLAPVRYLIRPAIETARNYPYSFATIVLLTLGSTLALLVGALPLPILLNQFLLTSTLTIKFSLISTFSIALGAFLTKGFNTAREFFYGLITPVPSAREQRYAVDERNQNTDYPIYILQTKSRPTLASLNTLPSLNCPLLIKHHNNLFIYGHSSKGEAQLCKLKVSYDKKCKFYDRKGEGEERHYYHDLFNPLLSKEKSLLVPSHNIPWAIYEDINIVRGHHHQPKEGSTAKIAQALHAIDIDHVEVRALKDQDGWYSAALFTGTESFFYPRQKEEGDIQTPSVAIPPPLSN